MDRPKLLRRLRIATSTLCLLICVAFLVLWIRSYSWRDNLYLQYYRGQFVHFASEHGKCAITLREGGTGLPWPWLSHDSWHYSPLPREFPFDFDSATEPEFHAYWFGISAAGVIAPHWSVLIALTALVVAFGIGTPYRFSLRTLLITTTLIAFVLGAVVYSLR